MLLAHAPSPVIRLHRAVALAHVAGAEAALVKLSTMDEQLAGHHLFYATKAELLRQLGRPEQARDADRRALELTANPAQQALLAQRILEG
jgi:predicted RNA polymerase sigma factor